MMAVPMYIGTVSYTHLDVYKRQELPIAKMLSEINIATNPWKGSDYVKGAKINNQQKKLPLLDAMNNLVNKGYSLTSASKWLTFTSRINKKVMDCAIDGNIVDAVSYTHL